MIFSKEKPKNCRGCKHRDKCVGEKKKCVYRLKVLEASLEVSFPCRTCAYGTHHEICFPCYKDMMGQPGIEEWKKDHPKLILE